MASEGRLAERLKRPMAGCELVGLYAPDQPLNQDQATDDLKLPSEQVHHKEASEWKSTFRSAELGRSFSLRIIG